MRINSPVVATFEQSENVTITYVQLKLQLSVAMAWPTLASTIIGSKFTTLQLTYAHTGSYRDLSSVLPPTDSSTDQN